MDEDVKSDELDVEGPESAPSDTGDEPAPTGDDKGEEKLFTQADINRIVGQRLSEEKAKRQELERKASVLDQMLEDPRFQKWIDAEVSGETQTEPDPFEELREDDPRLAAMVEKAVQKAISSQQSNLAGISANVESVRARLEVREMIAATDADGQPMYPRMALPEFRETMAQLIEERPGLSLQDAYALAERPLLLEETKKYRSASSKREKDAELLESKGRSGSPGRGKAKAPKTYASPLEAVEDIMKQRGM